MAVRVLFFAFFIVRYIGSPWPVSYTHLLADVMKAAEEGKLEEVFGTGTAAVVSHVKELDWEGKVANISGGKIGPLTQKLYATLTKKEWLLWLCSDVDKRQAMCLTPVLSFQPINRSLSFILL